MASAMGGALSVVKLAALAALVGSTVFRHHGHIIMFLDGVQAALLRRLPKRLRAHSLRPRASVLQIFFEAPHIHYEVSVRRKTRSVEIGLHFEGDREENGRWAQALAPHAVEIQAQLGPNVELEKWTRNWTRLHEARPVGGDDWRPKRDLTAELTEEVAERLARFIEVLEPILAEERAGVVR